MSRRIFLISEGNVEIRVFRRICERLNLNTNIVWRQPSGGKKGISRLAIQIETLIRIAMLDKQPGDCIIVIHDADLQTNPQPKDRRLYDQIRRICESDEFKDHVTLIIARDEIEAWLLADVALCKWLGVAPKNNDETPRPSKTLNDLIKKKHPRMAWSERYWDSVLDQIDASGDTHSPSMRDALAAVRALPCAQP